MNGNEKLRVLFVEDSEDDMALLLEVLSGDYPDIHHQRVDCASSLHAALYQESWDIVISDHNLPSLDAPAALQLVRALGDEIPFIIVSGEIPEPVAVALMKNGAADMIPKDNLARFLPSVQRELAKTRKFSELRQLYEDTRRIAYFDPLSGLPNREYLAHMVAELLGGDAPPKIMALLLININRFRQMSRMLGIAVTNQVLRKIGGRITKNIHENSVAFHLGSDHFAVIFPDVANDGEVIQQIELVCGNLREAIPVGDHELFLTAHVGASVYPRDGANLPDLLANAETAMHQARGAHKCNFLFFDRSMNAVGHEQVIMEHDLHRALKNGEFLLHYQPQIDLRTGKIIGVEALIRWKHPSKGIVPPNQFIPVLEETGLILPVGEWVLREACARSKAWQQAGLPHIRMAVNLSSIQFQQPELVPMVRDVLIETGLESQWLELEITESIAMFNEEATIATLTDLRAIGIHLALDDFGTGYSSLSYLKRFPLHKLKIDKSFVQDINANEGGAPIVKSIISLAKNLNLQVIAEGVETEAQLEFLANCGCDEVQGYLFSKPLPEEVLVTFLRENAAAAQPGRNIPTFLRAFPTEEISNC